MYIYILHRIDNAYNNATVCLPSENASLKKYLLNNFETKI